MRASVERWLAARGYRLSDEPLLFDLDAESERSAFLVWNDRWTVLYFSHWDEERRLIRELQPSEAPLLYVWVYDSDVWGFDLFSEHGFAGTFSSDPRSHSSFADDSALSEPRPDAVPIEVCSALGLDPELAADIARLQRKTSAFQEDLCRELCELIGAGPALASYDDLETGKLDHRLGGWRIEQWVYYHYDVARSTIEGELDLHAIEVDGPVPPQLRQLTGTRPLRLSPDLLAEMEEMRRRSRMTILVLRPLSLLARGWRRGKELLYRALLGGRRPALPRGVSPVVVQPTASQTRQEAVNRRHGVRLILPVGVDLLAVSGKPASVFAFKVGDTRVTCTARRLRYLWEVMKPPARSKILRDERYRVGPLPARHLFFELPASRFSLDPEVRYLGLHVLQTYRALYVFLYRFTGQVEEDVEEKIRTTVESFREQAEALAGRRPPRGGRLGDSGAHSRVPDTEAETPASKDRRSGVPSGGARS